MSKEARFAIIDDTTTNPARISEFIAKSNIGRISNITPTTPAQEALEIVNLVKEGLQQSKTGQEPHFWVVSDHVKELEKATETIAGNDIQTKNIFERVTIVELGSTTIAYEKNELSGIRTGKIPLFLNPYHPNRPIAA